MGQLLNQVALITGASRGIGKSIADTLAAEGATVCLFDLNKEALAITEQEFTDKGFKVLTFTVDVSNRQQVDKAIKEIIAQEGKLDILINNAGIIRDNLLFKMTDDDWEAVMNVHLKGTFICSQIAQSYMIEQRYGRIVNISSTSALGNRGQANYATAKAGLQGFTKTLAIELGKYGITVNAVAPGFIETDMTKITSERIGIAFEDLIKEKCKSIPVGRSGKPEDIANAVLFFALEKSSFVNGQVLYVAGGPKA
ncbi:beta-ketoacyl-ACP reductase [Alkalihalophilus pseudofirmus]|nr:beta-ketoacyl-ACP reductase [Alkalihalophilus pseudofirmus]